MFTNEFEFDSTITTVIVSPIGFGARSGRGAAEVSVFFFSATGLGGVGISHIHTHHTQNQNASFRPSERPYGVERPQIQITGIQ